MSTSTVTMVDITDLPAAVVLAALYNNQHVEGVGGRSVLDGAMSIKQAQSILTLDGARVDTLFGRPIGVHFGNWVDGKLRFDPTVYDAERGEGAAATVVLYLNELLSGALEMALKDLGPMLV